MLPGLITSGFALCTLPVSIVCDPIIQIRGFKMCKPRGEEIQRIFVFGLETGRFRRFDGLSFLCRRHFSLAMVLRFWYAGFVELLLGRERTIFVCFGL